MSLRDYRWGGFSLIDIYGTLVIAAVLHSRYQSSSFLTLVFFLTLIGESLHLAFRQSTPITKKIWSLFYHDTS